MATRSERAAKRDAVRKLDPEEETVVTTRRRVSKRRTVFDLSDETVAAASVDFKKPVYSHSVRIHDFSGMENEVEVGSVTRAAGKLLHNATSIIMEGDNIVSAEIKRMIPLAVKTVRELSFQSCTSLVIGAVFQQRRRFDSLTKLSLAYKSIPTPLDTRILENFSDLSNGPILPCLEHFQIVYQLDKNAAEDLYRETCWISPHDVFANYLATVRAIAHFGGSLKTVEIRRNELFLKLIGKSKNLTAVLLRQSQQDCVQKCAAAFAKLQLKSVYVSMIHCEGIRPWTLETKLTQAVGKRKVSTFAEKPRLIVDTNKAQPPWKPKPLPSKVLMPGIGILYTKPGRPQNLSLTTANKPSSNATTFDNPLWRLWRESEIIIIVAVLLFFICIGLIIA